MIYVPINTATGHVAGKEYNTKVHFVLPRLLQLWVVSITFETNKKLRYLLLMVTEFFLHDIHGRLLQ